MKANRSCKHRGPESFHRQLGWGCSSWWWSSLAEWLRVMTKPLFDFKAKEGSKADVFHDVVTILKPFSCPYYETTTGGCWLLLDLLLVHKQVAEKSLLIQRWGWVQHKSKGSLLAAQRDFYPGRALLCGYWLVAIDRWIHCGPAVYLDRTALLLDL